MSRGAAGMLGLLTIWSAGCGQSGLAVSTDASAPIDGNAPSGDSGSAFLWSVEPEVPGASVLLTIWGSGDDLYTAGYGDNIAHSGDAGKTWSSVATGFAATASSSQIAHLVGSGGSDVWAVARGQGRSMLLHSADRGSSWQPRPVDLVAFADHLEAAWSFDGQTILAASYDAGIARSEDGGVSWSHVEVEAGSLLFGLWASSPSDVYAVGGSPTDTATDLQGLIFHSADAGKTWTKVLTAPTGQLWNIWGTPDGRVVYAAGPAATVAWTVNGGETWQTNGRARSSSSNADFDLPAVWVSPDDGRPFLASPKEIIRDISTDGDTVVNGEKLPPNPVPCQTGTDCSFTVSVLNALGIWGTAETNVWAVGPNASLWHRP